MLADSFLLCGPLIQQFDFLLSSLSAFGAVHQYPGMVVLGWYFLLRCGHCILTVPIKVLYWSYLGEYDLAW